MDVDHLGLYVTVHYSSNLPIDTIIELSHRAVSGLSLIVVLWLAITAWKHIGYIREKAISNYQYCIFTSSSIDWCSSCHLATKFIRISTALRYIFNQFLFSVCFNAYHFEVDKNMKLMNYISESH